VYSLSIRRNIKYDILLLYCMPKGHVDQLGEKIRELQGIFQEFGEAKRDLGQLWKVIHQPGYTTPAELVLLDSILNAEKKYAQTTLQLNRALLSGASKVELNPQPLPPRQNERVT